MSVQSRPTAFAATPEQLCNLICQHLPRGGVTVSPSGKVFTSGLCVGENPYNDLIIKTSCTYNMQHDIIRYIASTEDMNKVQAFGAWINPEDNLLYMDRVSVYTTAQIRTAVKQAQAYNQKSIYLLDEQQTLWLK